MKKKVIILWCAFVVCLITTVALWFAMNNSKLKYEEVEARGVCIGTLQKIR